MSKGEIDHHLSLCFHKSSAADASQCICMLERVNYTFVEGWIKWVSYVAKSQISSFARIFSITICRRCVKMHLIVGKVSCHEI